jgi:hypothetical protein
VSLPYSVQTNDVPAYFEMKASVPEFEAMLKRQFDTLYREGEIVPRVMAIAVHPFVTGERIVPGNGEEHPDIVPIHRPATRSLRTGEDAGSPQHIPKFKRPGRCPRIRAIELINSPLVAREMGVSDRANKAKNCADTMMLRKR